MSQQTAIEWTDLSWNPVHGCSKVSPGCAHCYAETLSRRYGHTSEPWTPAHAVENVAVKPHTLRQPLSRARQWQGLGVAAAAAGKVDGKLVFVNSMSDLFHEEVHDQFIADVFAIMARAERHTFQVLTKRPERMVKFLNGGWFPNEIDGQVGDFVPWPLPNVWLGVSIENRRFVHRADLLRDTPAAVRFISAEPLLGPLMATQNIGHPTDYGTGYEHDVCWEDGRTMDDDLPSLNLAEIDWLILGGESGPNHRHLDLQWMRDLRDAAEMTSTAVFVKQLGGARPGGRLEDLPEDLRIRAFPRQLALNTGSER